MPATTQQAADYIVPLNMNGLDGRMLYMPAAKRGAKREVLVVYGHHSTLERWWGLAQDLNKYGAITMPDLPGFGGMDSFYKIGKRPTLDNLADYLASFVKWRYKRRSVSIVGMSFGFLVVTRMLQRYPELTKHVELLISGVGFAHHSDFVFSQTRMFWYRVVSRFFSWRIPALGFRYIGLDPWVIRKVYHKTFNGRKKFIGADKERRARLLEMEVVLWHANEMRTHWMTTNIMLNVDNCGQRVNLPVWHIASSDDQYFDQRTTEQHLRVIFKDLYCVINKSLMHTPSVIADKKESAAFIPPELRRVLSQQRTHLTKRRPARKQKLI